jgi:adenylate cyclase
LPIAVEANVPIEIERKFLMSSGELNLLVELAPSWRSTSLTRGYLSTEVDMGVIIVNHRSGIARDSFAMLTHKVGTGLSRKETEVHIPIPFARDLLSIAKGIVRKVRHDFTFKGVHLEVDVFEARHTGLIIAEVEFASIEEANSWEPPLFFGREVTNSHQYSNHKLAFHEEGSLIAE